MRKIMIKKRARTRAFAPLTYMAVKRNKFRAPGERADEAVRASDHSSAHERILNEPEPLLVRPQS